MTSNGMTCWIVGLSLIALTIVSLVYVAVFLGWRVGGLRS
jgi:hypothetical protein